MPARRALFGRFLLAIGLVCPAPPLPAQQTMGIVARASPGRIVGTVYDSITMRPLAGATVQLALVPERGNIGRVRTVQSDSLGRYDFDGVDPGTYLLGFQHVAVDSLGLRGPLQRVDLRTAATVRTAMSIPSMTSIIRTVCGRDGDRDSLAVLLGSVRDARSDAPLPGAFVSLRWGEVEVTRDGRLLRTTPIVDVFANDEGWFTACVPGGVPLTIRASHLNDISGNIEFPVPTQAVLRRDLYVGPAEAEIRPAAPGDQAGRDAEHVIVRGTGKARGVVRAISGQPIAGARVALLNGAAEARTDEQGEFQLGGLPHGTHMLEARAIGYVPGQVIVNVVEFGQEPASLILVDVSAYLLDTVRVAAVRRLEAAARAGFERRRKSGAGYFVDEADLDTVVASAFRDLVRRVPGVRFVPGRTPEDRWREHIEFTSGGVACSPVIYLDGAQLIHAQTDLDLLVNPASVRRIEVYHRGTAIPAEFASGDRCGVLAIWTGNRRRR